MWGDMTRKRSPIDDLFRQAGGPHRGLLLFVGNPGKETDNMTWEEYVKYLKANSSPETIACIEEAQQRAALYRTSFASEVEHAAKRSGANARVPFG